MPVPTETLWNIRRLNVVFGLTSLVGLVSMGWMLWHDYNRPWRGIQQDYFNLRSALAHFTVLSYESDEEKKKHEALQSAVASAETVLNRPETKQQLEQFEREERELSGRLAGVSLAYGNRNAELGVTLFQYEELEAVHGPDYPKTLAMKAKYDADRAVVEELKSEQDLLEDQVRDRKRQLMDLYAAKTAAKKALDAYEKGRDDAEYRDRMFGPGIMRTTLNLPILEYAPPKGVAGRQQINQFFMPDIRFDYNFIDSYVTDRCTTCHIAINDPDFSRANFIQKAEAAIRTEAVSKTLKKENEDLVRDMHRRLADVNLSDFRPSDLQPQGEEDTDARKRFVNSLVNVANGYLDEIRRPRLRSLTVREKLKGLPLDRGTVQSVIEHQFRNILKAEFYAPGDAQEEHPLKYYEMSENLREDYFKSVAAAMNLYLGRNERPEVDFEPVLRAHPRLDLFVSVDSPHSVRKMGCSVCHEGSGQETDFVLAAHTPKNEEEKHRWEEKYYVKELGVLPLATFHLVEEYWERPMLRPEYISASCAKCHDQIFDLERHRTEPIPEAHNIVKGRELFTKLGCINCHNVEGLTDSPRVGTDLTFVADKLSTGFMEKWVEYPNNFRPSTRMPHFFKQENNLASSANNEFDPNPELRVETEIKAMVHYLRTFSRSYDPIPLPEGLTGDPKRGEELFTSIGCLACHVNLDARDPLDEDGRTFAEKWIIPDIAQDKARQRADQLLREGRRVTVEEKTALRDEAMAEASEVFGGMSKNDRARYAARRFSTKRRQAAQKSADDELFNADIAGEDPDPFRTYVPPAFERHGPELSGIGTKLVDQPDDAAQVAHGRQWLYSWLREPRHYSETTLMPRMFRDTHYQLDPPDEQGRKNDQDNLDITDYLLTLRTDDFDSTAFPETSAHDAEMQRLILMLLAGQNTESVSKKILNDEKMDSSDPYGPLTRSIVALTYRSFGDGDEGRQRVAALIKVKSPSLKDRQKLFLGMKMISHYGCFSCHKITGLEDATRPGTDLSLWGQKFLSQLDFAFYSPVFEHERAERPEIFENIYIDAPEYAHLIRDIGEDAEHLLRGAGGNLPHEVLHNHAAFAYHKMRNPRIWDREKYKKPYEKLKMPNYFFTEAEARALTTYLLSKRTPDVTANVRLDYKNTTTGMIARGRALARELNCIGCHTIEGNREANIHQYYTTDTSVDDNFPYGQRFKPPLLWGEGAKIQHDWLFGFLNNVELLRPWLKARMPSFYLSVEDATTLVEYFAGLSQTEARFLEGELTPIAKYLQQVHSGLVQEDSNWFAREKFADTAEFLKRYALTHQQAIPYDFDASSAESRSEEIEALAPGFEKVVQRTEFLANLYDVNFPFSDPQAHAIDDERFKLGEEFFYDQKCLACHVGGDPSVPGTTTDIKAPNFNLTYKRLRYDWLYDWLQDPQAIQPGANMPQIFQGGSAYASLPEDVRSEREARFGKTVDEQARLMLDFLVALGERRYTAIQPGGPAQAPETTQEGEADFDFDDDDAGAEEEPEFDFDDD